jgi:hypothetical protein
MSALKAALGLLPKGAHKEEPAKKIEEAEEALKRSDAKLAKELEYKLCKCTFPPQIMLWQEPRQAHVCPGCAKATRMLPKPQCQLQHVKDFTLIRPVTPAHCTRLNRGLAREVSEHCRNSIVWSSQTLFARLIMDMASSPDASSTIVSRASAAVAPNSRTQG